jgi:hypothetical protein
MSTLVKELHDAHLRTGRSYAELARLSGLRIDRSNLRRKLRGELPLWLTEYSALARAVGGFVLLAFPPEAGQHPSPLI